MEDQIAADEALAKALQRQESDAAEEQLRNEATNRSRQTRGLASAKPKDDWSSWLDSAANTGGDFLMKAANVAAEKATVLASKAEEMRSKIDLDNVFSGSIGMDDVTASGKAVRRINDELDFVYVTENLVAMAYPADVSKQGSSTSGNDINKVAAYLKKHHEGKFMIWNISEETYDSSRFADQVLEYRFPGHPAPPLGLLFKICTSIESWLDADEENVGIIHCLTGKGRTATLMACVLTWIGEFTSPVKALEYIADRKGIAVENLTIPSQPRYLTYFSNMLDGVKPRSEPLLLRRVIMNTIPIYGNNGGGEDSQGCCPYLQLFKGGKLISTSVPVNENDVKTKAEGNNKALLQWSKASDGCVSFNVDCALQGDILLRARHASNTGQRISMFRAAFHTGYVPAGVLRLTKEWLDGAADSSRFSDDFFIDLIFAPMGVRLPGDEDGSSDISPPESGGKDDGERGGLKAPGGGPPPPPGKLGVVAAPSDSGLLIDASSADRYEQTLHNDSRFWEAVGARKNKAKSRKSRKFKSVVRETFTLDDGEDGSYDEDDDMVSNVVKARSTTMDRVRESKDRDLIEALAQAEAEDQDGDSNRAGLEDSELNISGAGVESVGLGLSATPAKQGGSGAGEGGAQEAVSKELAELAELEKELGLDSSAATATSDGSSAGGGGGEAGGADGAGAEDGDGDLDDLDDLERYLASIQS